MIDIEEWLPDFLEEQCMVKITQLHKWQMWEVQYKSWSDQNKDFA
jgi:hypothetical protein